MGYRVSLRMVSEFIPDLKFSQSHEVSIHLFGFRWLPNKQHQVPVQVITL